MAVNVKETAMEIALNVYVEAAMLIALFLVSAITKHYFGISVRAIFTTILSVGTVSYCGITAAAHIICARKN